MANSDKIYCTTNAKAAPDAPQEARAQAAAAATGFQQMRAMARQ
jgi:hypothetical protein